MLAMNMETKERKLTDHDKLCQANLLAIWKKRKEESKGALTYAVAAEFFGTTDAIPAFQLKKDRKLSVRYIVLWSRLLKCSYEDIDPAFSERVLAETNLEYIKGAVYKREAQGLEVNVEKLASVIKMMDGMERYRKGDKLSALEKAKIIIDSLKD